MNNNFTDSTAFKLHRANILLDRLADEYLVRVHGIHYAPFLVLLMVGVLEPTSQQAIAANLGVSRASVTQRLRALTGLVDVTPDPHDSRAHRVRLSEAGAVTLAAAWQGLEVRRNGIDNGVDEATLVGQLDQLIANSIRILGSPS